MVIVSFSKNFTKIKYWLISVVDPHSEYTRQHYEETALGTLKQTIQTKTEPHYKQMNMCCEIF